MQQKSVGTLIWCSPPYLKELKKNKVNQYSVYQSIVIVYPLSEISIKIIYGTIYMYLKINNTALIKQANLRSEGCPEKCFNLFKMQHREAIYVLDMSN